MNLKTIKTTIILGEGQFADGNNTKIIEGLSTKVMVQKNGLPEKHSAKVTLTNIAMADMEQMTFLSFRPLQKRKNKILIEAGDVGTELATVFKGDITSAFPDFSNAPDVTFEIEGITAGWNFLTAESPTSINGEADAAQLIEQFAKQAGFGFVNNGVSASVKNTTFTGSPASKAKQVADEIGKELLMDDDTFTLQEWGKPIGEAVLLNASSGLIGYPSFTSEGVSCKSFFNPKLRLGGQIKIESIVPKATGYWKITKLSHSLSAYNSTPEWISNIEGIWLKEAEGQEDKKVE